MSASHNLKHLHFTFELPKEFYEKLGSIYQSAFAVQEYFKIFHNRYDYNALFIFEDSPERSHILFYVLQKREVIVLNELFRIEPEYLLYFIDFIFANFHFVRTIRLNRLGDYAPDETHYPVLVKDAAEDVVLELPPSIEQYDSTLSRHTKKNLRNYINRFQKNYPDSVFDAQEADGINPASVSRIIEMNRIRMTSKKIKSGFDLGHERKIIDFCRKFGQVCTITVNGRIIAGTISYLIGSHVYLETISHDQEYNTSRVGQICLYWTIKTFIEKGMSHFHMLWGEYEYKYRFKGIKHKLNTVLIFRRRGLIYFREFLLYKTAKLFAHFKRQVRLHIYEKIKKFLPEGMKL